MEAAKNMNMLEVKLIDMGGLGDELEQRMTNRAYELQKEKERINNTEETKCPPARPTAPSPRPKAGR